MFFLLVNYESFIISNIKINYPYSQQFKDAYKIITYHNLSYIIFLLNR